MRWNSFALGAYAQGEYCKEARIIYLGWVLRAPRLSPLFLNKSSRHHAGCGYTNLHPYSTKLLQRVVNNNREEVYSEPYHSDDVVAVRLHAVASVQVLSAAKSHIKRAANCSIIHGSLLFASVLIQPINARGYGAARVWWKLTLSAADCPLEACWLSFSLKFVCARSLYRTKPPCLSCCCWKLRGTTVYEEAALELGLVIMISVTYTTLLVSATVVPLGPWKEAGDIVWS